MNKKLIFTAIIFLTGYFSASAQQIDSAGIGEQNYTPLSLLFSNAESDNLSYISSADSASTVKWVPVKEKSSAVKDYFYVLGTAAVAAVIYFLWPEDNPPAQKKLTFGTPPPPR